MRQQQQKKSLEDDVRDLKLRMDTLETKVEKEVKRVDTLEEAVATVQERTDILDENQQQLVDVVQEQETLLLKMERRIADIGPGGVSSMKLLCGSLFVIFSIFGMWIFISLWSRFMDNLFSPVSI